MISSSVSVPGSYPSADGAFIYERCFFTIPEMNFPTVGVEIKYHIDRYDDGLFNVLGLGMPPQIMRSLPRRRAEFLAGRYAARLALAALNSRACDVPIGQNRIPIWPLGYSGSISHVIDRAVCVATPQARYSIGVDLEQRISPHVRQEIASQVVSNRELATLRCPSIDPEMGITLAFSAKEAFFKMMYPKLRRYFGFLAVAVVEIDQVTKVLKLAAQKELGLGFSAPNVFPVHFTIIDDLVRTLCWCEC